MKTCFYEIQFKKKTFLNSYQVRRQYNSLRRYHLVFKGCQNILIIRLVLRCITVINGQKSMKSYLSAFGIKRDCKAYFVGHFFAWVDINTAINKNTVQL